MKSCSLKHPHHTIYQQLSNYNRHNIKIQAIFAYNLQSVLIYKQTNRQMLNNC